MQKLSDLKPGDTVVLVQTDRPDKRAKVTKVGRTLLHVEGSQEPFDLTTGQDRSKYGYSTYALTLDQDDRRVSVVKARKDLRAFGVAVGGSDDKILAVRLALDALLQADVKR